MAVIVTVVGRGGVQPVEAGVAARAHADPADIDLVVGAARRKHRRSRGNRSRLQEITAIEFVAHKTSNSMIAWSGRSVCVVWQACYGNCSSAASLTRILASSPSPSFSAQPARIRRPCSTSVRRYAGSGVLVAMSPSARSRRRLTATSPFEYMRICSKADSTSRSKSIHGMTHAHHARRIVEHRFGRLARGEADQDRGSTGPRS